jgi:hypothetical protein
MMEFPAATRWRIQREKKEYGSRYRREGVLENRTDQK